jgi:hypothetical protein
MGRRLSLDAGVQSVPRPVAERFAVSKPRRDGDHFVVNKNLVYKNVMMSVFLHITLKKLKKLIN